MGRKERGGEGERRSLPDLNWIFLPGPEDGHVLTPAQSSAAGNWLFGGTRCAVCASEFRLFSPASRVVCRLYEAVTHVTCRRKLRNTAQSPSWETHTELAARVFDACRPVANILSEQALGSLAVSAGRGLQRPQGAGRPSATRVVRETDPVLRGIKRGRVGADVRPA